MRTIALVVIVIVLVWPARVLLVRARWTAWTPRAAVALWQAIALAVGVALIGACFNLAVSSSPQANPRRNLSDFALTGEALRPVRGFTPNELFGLTAGLIVATLLLGALAVRIVGQMRSRARYQMLVDLVGDDCAEIPGAVVVEHPRAASYGVPGSSARIVVSSGAVEALSKDELDAVLAHERAHLRGRHDVVLLPFRALDAALPRSRSLAAVSENVRALLEMAADDRAVRENDPRVLARALCRMSIAQVQPAVPNERLSFVNRRVERVLEPRRSTKLLVLGTGLSTAGILAVPFLVLFTTFGGR